MKALVLGAGGFIGNHMVQIGFKDMMSMVTSKIQIFLSQNLTILF